MIKSVTILLFCIIAVACSKTDTPALSWTQEVMEKGKTTYESILEHPFIQEMAAGTLAEERFARYIAQDEVYAAEKDKQTRDAMTAQFLTSLQYEYDFWNYGYYGE